MKTADLKQELKEKGYKMTNQRETIYDLFLRNKGMHLSSQEVYDLLHKENSDIGVATVYRTLLLLEEMGLIDALDLGDGLTRYEIHKDGEKHRHHHLICLKCGSITEAKEDLLDFIEDEILKRDNFRVKDHNVKFYGYCKDCME